MPKKRSQLPYSKPASSVHPALINHGRRSASHASNRGPTGCDSGDRVNDLIQHLRITQVSTNQQHGTACESANPRTLHPSLRAMMNIPDTPPPRPRPGVRVHAVGGRRTRGPAGPPPPVSWTYSPLQRCSISTKEQENPSSDLGVRYNDPLPGMAMLGERSLYNMALKQMGRNWQWHAHYDQFYLAALPVWMKQQLLSSIARYNEEPLEVKDLQLLFLDETQLPEATGSETVTHLDLSRSLTGLKSLASYLTKKPLDPQNTVISAAATSDASHNTSDSPIPESWEDAPAPSTTRSLSMLRFPYLTHLSLASLKSPSWSSLLSVLPITATLTHLSLAHWPIPCLTPNSSTAYTRSPQGNVPHGGSNLYSSFDGDFSEAAGIMRRLSKGTYCLQWLDLSGCADWAVNVLEHEGPDWHSAWRGLETIKLHQPWRPRCIDDDRWVDLLRSELDTRPNPKIPQMLEQRLSDVEKGEASNLVGWLRNEIYINSKLNMVRRIMISRFEAFHLTHGGERIRRFPDNRSGFDDDSWWVSSSGQARPDPTRDDPLRSDTPPMRRKLVTFDQGWESHPHIKACINAYLERYPMGRQSMGALPMT